MSQNSCFETEIVNNKNKQNVRCIYCNSLILGVQQANGYEKKQFSLPMMMKKNSKEANEIETEMLEDFWIINDMFSFENVGFSNTVDKTKYLICADCDMGPVGYHDIETKLCYIALKRVKHGNSEEKS